MKTFMKVAGLGAIFICLGDLAQAQGSEPDVSLRVIGGTVDSKLGKYMTPAGDANGDGYGDYWASDNTPPSPNITLHLFSGKDGAILSSIPTTEDRITALVGGVDMDADGWPDFFTIDNRIPRNFRFYSAATGNILLKLPMAPNDYSSAAGFTDDANGDGTPDFFLGSPTYSEPGLGQSGRFRLFSGINGSVIWEFHGLHKGDRLGWSAISIKDLNGDSTRDFLVGSPGEENQALLNAGKVYALSGVDGSILWEVLDNAQHKSLGKSLAALEDLNQDGIEDFAVGRPGFNTPQFRARGSIEIRSGLDGSFIRAIYGDEAFDNLGKTIQGLGDLNGDGYPELLALSERTLFSSDEITLHLYSAANGRELARYIDTSSISNSLHTARPILGSNFERLDGFFRSDDHYPSATPDTKGIVRTYWRSSLDLSHELFSARDGGTMNLEVGPYFEYPNYFYRVLISASGPGSFSVGGLEIPLALDNKVVNSWHGNYAGYLAGGMQGQLDTHGHATPWLLALPGVIPTSLIGTEFSFATVLQANPLAPFTVVTESESLRIAF